MTDQRKKEWAALTFAMVFPFLVTLLYFHLLAGSLPAVQQAAYLMGKTLQFAFPVVWCGWIVRERWGWNLPSRRGLIAGLGFGLVVFVLMLVLYREVFRPWGAFAVAGEAIRAKVVGMGLGSLWKYGLLGVFYSLCHSWLEEYYWRWFVFRRLSLLVPAGAAILVSSLAFMAHHVILLGTFFGAGSPWTVCFSLAVAVGGVFWAWLYRRSGSLYGPWLSHLLVDAAIFWIGYDLVADLLVG